MGDLSQKIKWELSAGISFFKIPQKEKAKPSHIINSGAKAFSLTFWKTTGQQCKGSGSERTGQAAGKIIKWVHIPRNRTPEKREVKTMEKDKVKQAPIIYTLQETAEILRVTERTIYTYIYQKLHIPEEA